MKVRTLLFGACAIALGMGAVPATPSRAADAECTTVAPTDAVTTLPAPLNKWGQILCTPLGYVLTGHQGWVWMQPADHSLVIIPAQLKGAVKASSSDGQAADAGTVSYFTKIQMTKITGDEFDKAYSAFHEGFDPNEQKPIGYRLELASAGGNTLTLYLFDYFSYGWGIACTGGDCDKGSRFVMLDMEKKPAELGPPI